MRLKLEGGWCPGDSKGERQEGSASGGGGAARGFPGTRELPVGLPCSESVTAEEGFFRDTSTWLGWSSRRGTRVSKAKVKNMSDILSFSIT